MNKSIPEVKEYLTIVKEVAKDEERTTINNKPWSNGKVNKTQKYMNEYGIDEEAMRNTI